MTLTCKEGVPKTAGELPRGNETILVVEDDNLVRDIASQVLQLHGYTVFAAANGLEAVDIYRQTEGRIHLIITDLVLPGMSGRSLLDYVRSSGKPCRFLFMSGYSGEVVVRHGIMEEGISFISKPFEFETLMVKVRQVLDGCGTEGR